MNDDEQYLRDLGYSEDTWVLSGQQWYTTGEVAQHLGLSEGGVRNLAERGVIPGAILHDAKRIGWRLPRQGLIAYLAAQRRHTEQRQQPNIS
jgi:hypothetical protein